MKDLKQKAVSILRQYYEATEKVECTDGFFSQFLYFMNGNDEGHSVNAIYYGGYCEGAMKAFADPRLATLMAESMGDDYPRFVEMIFRLLSLMNSLIQHDHYEALIESYNIDLYGGSESNVQDEMEKAERLLAALRARHPEKNFNPPKLLP
jgi:hypothetical protein